ncbi:hypothetical protein GOP47_0017826, partial [Adiantum capillus-veneris]
MTMSERAILEQDASVAFAEPCNTYRTDDMFSICSRFGSSREEKAKQCLARRKILVLELRHPWARHAKGLHMKTMTDPLVEELTQLSSVGESRCRSDKFTAHATHNFNPKTCSQAQGMKTNAIQHLRPHLLTALNGVAPKITRIHNLEKHPDSARLQHSTHRTAVKVEDAENLKKALTVGLQSQRCRVKQLRILWDVSLHSETMNALTLENPNCSVTRLDLRDSYESAGQEKKGLFFRWKWSKSITDLGLTLSNTKPLLDSRLHTRLLTLRLKFSTDLEGESRCWQMLVRQALADASCTLQFLDCEFPWEFDDLCSTLSEYLSTSHLVYLEVNTPHASKYFRESGDEFECADSLIHNYSLLSLTLPWKNEAAEARSAELVRRNHRYAAGQLLKEQQLILCARVPKPPRLLAE